MLYGKWLTSNDDLGDIRRIREQIAAEEADQKNEQMFDNSLFDEHDEIGIHLIVYEEGEPVSAGRIEWLSDLETIEISRVAVEKNHRGQKIGDFTMRVLLDKAFRSGAENISLLCSKETAGFFRTVGFQTVMENPDGTVRMLCHAMPASPCEKARQAMQARKQTQEETGGI